MNVVDFSEHKEYKQKNNKIKNDKKIGQNRFISSSVESRHKHVMREYAEHQIYVRCGV